jgi:hypothetical protein
MLLLPPASCSAVDDDTTRPGWQQGTLVRVALGPAGARDLDVMMAQLSDRT